MCAVPAGRDHEVRSLVSGAASQFEQVLGVPALVDLQLDPGSTENLERTRKPATGLTSACPWVVQNRYFHKCE